MCFGSAHWEGCWRQRWPMPACATKREEAGMTLDLWLAAIVALGLLLYLVAALIRPERF